MPYKSDAQRKYFNVNRKKLEAQGVDVDEWNEASKGKKLPEKVDDNEKKAFVRSLIHYLIEKSKKPTQAAKPQSTEATQAMSQEPGAEKKAFSGLVGVLPEIGGAATGGFIGSQMTPEVTSSNNPIINRVRGDVERPNAMMQNIIRGALAGGLGVMGARTGHSVGTAAVQNTLARAILNRMPTIDSAVSRVVPQLAAVGGGGLSGAGGVMGYDFLKHLVDKQMHDNKKAAAKLSPTEINAFIDLVKAARCWQGYEPVPGKKAYSDGSCRPVGGKDKKDEKKAGFYSGLEGARIGSALVPGMAAGGLAGLAKGVYEDPGHDERTGKKKSRLINALKNALGGAAIGGVAMKAMGPETFRATYRATRDPLFSKIAPGALAGGAAGLAKGMYEDPGHDERTGKKKSRLANALKNTLGGAAIGGTTTALAGPQLSDFGARAGYSLGSKIGSDIEKLAFNSAMLQMGRSALNQGANMFGRGAYNLIGAGMRGAGQLGSAAMQAGAPVAQAGFNAARQGLNRIPGNALVGAGVGAAGMAALPMIAGGINRAGNAIGQGVLDAGQMAQSGINSAYNTAMAPVRGLQSAGESLGQGAFDAYQGARNAVGQGMQAGNQMMQSGVNAVNQVGQAGTNMINQALQTGNQGVQSARNMVGTGLNRFGNAISSAGNYVQGAPQQAQNYGGAPQPARKGFMERNFERKFNTGSDF